MLVVVSGATGTQGAGVVDACLKTGFKVRAITRNVESDAAKEMSAKGVEVVCADFSQPETLRAAYSGAVGAFLMSDFMGAFFDPEAEARQAKNQADAAVESGVRHLVFSSLDDPSQVLGDGDVPLVGGKWKAPSMDGKVLAERYMREKGYPATFIVPGFLMESLFAHMSPQPRGGGEFAIRFPSLGKKMPWVCKEDLGSIVAACFKEGPEKIVGIKPLRVAGDVLDLDEVASLLSKATGRKVAYEAQPDDECKEVMVGMGMPPDVAQGIVNGLVVQRKQAEDLDEPAALRAIVSESHTMEKWMEKHKEKLAALMPV